ncbi:MAG: hypothetical protein C0404_04385 [Verrucomicrobia bacterium]|nr:hypothetical protein [Verrucomicrobiota bacterium]
MCNTSRKIMKTDERPADFETPCFFEAGLQFECTGCGRCCTGEPGSIYVSPGEIDRIAALTGMPRPALVSEHLRPYKDSYSIRERPNGDCHFLLDNRCSIYAARPRQCSTFPFWLRILSVEANWRYTASRCPGIGRGRLFTKQQILEIISDERPCTPGS